MSNTEEYYDVWFRKFRRTELADLVIAGVKMLLYKGAITVDDMRAVPLKGDPRIRGGAVKALVSLGCAVKAEEVNSSSRVCHHRPIKMYRISDAGLCKRIINRYSNAVLGSIPSGAAVREEQGMLL